MSAFYECECDSFDMTEGQDSFEMNEGIPGPGVPAGGSAGQVLRKSSSEDYDTEWDTLDAGDVAFNKESGYLSGTVGRYLQLLDSEDVQYTYGGEKELGTVGETLDYLADKSVEIEEDVDDLRNTLNDFEINGVGYGADVCDAKLIYGNRGTNGILAGTDLTTTVTLDSVVSVQPNTKYFMKVGNITSAFRYYYYSSTDQTTMTYTNTSQITNGEYVFETPAGCYGFAFHCGDTSILGANCRIVLYTEKAPLIEVINNLDTLDTSGYNQDIDLNNYIEGYYMFSSATRSVANSPLGNTWTVGDVLIAYKTSNDASTQLLLANSIGCIFQRFRNSLGTWSAWKSTEYELKGTEENKSIIPLYFNNHPIANQYILDKVSVKNGHQALAVYNNHIFDFGVNKIWIDGIEHTITCGHSNSASFGNVLHGSFPRLYVCGLYDDNQVADKNIYVFEISNTLEPSLVETIELDNALTYILTAVVDETEEKIYTIQLSGADFVLSEHYFIVHDFNGDRIGNAVYIPDLPYTQDSTIVGDNIFVLYGVSTDVNPAKILILNKQGQKIGESNGISGLLQSEECEGLSIDLVTHNLWCATYQHIMTY